jgi:hypothetical protein
LGIDKVWAVTGKRKKPLAMVGRNEEAIAAFFSNAVIIIACVITLAVLNFQCNISGDSYVLDRTYMEKQREMLTTISDRMVKMMRMGYSVPEMLAAGVTKGYEEWGDPNTVRERLGEAALEDGEGCSNRNDDP